MLFTSTRANTYFYALCTYVVLLLATAAAFNGYFDKSRLVDWQSSPADIYGATTIASLLDGSGGRPYVYRQLLPTMANGLAAAVPAGVQDKFYDARNGMGIPIRELFFDSPVAQLRPYFLRYWFVWGMEVAFCFATTFAAYKLAMAVGLSRAAATVSGIVFILLVPFIMEPHGSIYDLPEMTFLIASMIFAIQGRWAWLIVLAAIATFNKESYLFFIPTLYPLLQMRLTQTKVWAALASIFPFERNRERIRAPEVSPKSWRSDELQVGAACA